MDAEDKSDLYGRRWISEDNVHTSGAKSKKEEDGVLRKPKLRETEQELL